MQVSRLTFGIGSRSGSATLVNGRKGLEADHWPKQAFGWRRFDLTKRVQKFMPEAFRIYRLTPAWIACRKMAGKHPA
jgi:hypothetical protein